MGGAAKVRTAYRLYDAAFSKGGPDGIRGWYEANLSPNYVAEAVNGRFLTNKQTILRDLPPSGATTRHVPMTTPVFTSTIGKWSAGGPHEIFVIVTERGTGQMTDSKGRFGHPRATHSLVSTMVSKDTWHEEQGVWKETSRQILSTSDSLDGKPLKQMYEASKAKMK